MKKTLRRGTRRVSIPANAVQRTRSRRGSSVGSGVSSLARRMAGLAVGRAVRRPTATRTRVTNKNHKALETRWGSETFFMRRRKPRGLPAKMAMKLLHLDMSLNFGGAENPNVYPSGILQMGCNAGVQNAYNLGSAFNIIDLQDMQQVIQQRIAGANPISLPATMTGPGAYTTRFFVDSVHQEFMIQNSDNAIARIIIYDIECKRDLYLSNTGGSVNDPVRAWVNGMKDEIGNTATGNEFSIIGCRPEESYMFNTYFKVSKRYYTMLAPGQTHCHRVTIEPRRLVGGELLNSQYQSAVKGLTHYTLIYFYGSPVGNFAGTAATTSAIKLNCVSRKDYKFSYLQNDTVIEFQQNTLSGTQTANLENLVTGASAAYAAV